MGNKENTEKILAYMAEHLDEFTGQLLDFACQEATSLGDFKGACDQSVVYAAELFREIGCQVEIIENTTAGNMLKATLGEGEQIMLLGHADTVFPPGTIGKDMFPRIEDGKLYGPGVFDMKSGILSMVYAIKALQELKMMPEKKITAVINTDEEAGSFGSRETTLQEARKSKCVLCLEPAPAGRDPGVLKTERYGRSEYSIKIHGKSAHSGNNPHDAVNPLLEMGRLIADLSELENQYEGVICSVVYAHGGMAKSAMIPGEAELHLDVRFENYESGNAVHEKLLALQPHDRQISLEVSGNIQKPPLTLDQRLFALAREIGRELGIEITGKKVGGGSDGNFTSGASVPTLDGLGQTGECIHNFGEHIYVENIPQRVALLARLIQEA